MAAKLQPIALKSKKKPAFRYFSRNTGFNGLSGHDLIDDIHFSAILSGFLYHRFLKRLCAILFYT